MNRTEQQNKALHKYFAMVAKEMTDAGYSDLMHFMSKPVEVPITQDNFKEMIWKKVQKAMLGRESTTELETPEVDQVYQVISRHLATSFNITTPFPSEDEL